MIMVMVMVMVMTMVIMVMVIVMVPPAGALTGPQTFCEGSAHVYACAPH